MTKTTFLFGEGNNPKNKGKQKTAQELNELTSLHKND